MLRPCHCAFLLLAIGSTDGQSSKAPPPIQPQTPRQVILEVMTAKDTKAIARHLPEATRAFWSARLSTLPSVLASGILMTMAAGQASDSEGTGVSVEYPKPNPNLEVFQAGPVLVRERDARTSTVSELRIDDDELIGDEDTMELSLHQTSFQGEEIPPIQFPSIRINMKLEKGTWRFEEIDFVQRLRLGDPQFARDTARRQAEESEAMAIAAISTIENAEKKYLKRSPDKQFSCQLTQLDPTSERAEGMSVSSSLRIAEARGYKLQLSNCDAAGFRVAAIPQQNGGRTMCADQTAVIKASTKGVADCFANGEPINSGEELPTSQ